MVTITDVEINDIFWFWVMVAGMEVVVTVAERCQYVFRYEDNY